ncbi:MAG: PfkB family carbohydrate kinase, partial [Limisphaerales bacterium]
MNNQEARRGILIIGSINTDLVARVDRLPDSGETLVAETLETYVGGKGANQAVAAARLGAQVSLVGRLGKDPNGQHNLKQLIEDGIRCDAIAL